MNGGTSRLFHAIVTMGASLGAACGGSVASPSGPGADASSDATDPPDAASDAPPDMLSTEAGADGGLALPDSAADAADGDACAAPGSEGQPCGGPLQCCHAGACFPCFV